MTETVEATVSPEAAGELRKGAQIAASLMREQVSISETGLTALIGTILASAAISMSLAGRRDSFEVVTRISTMAIAMAESTHRDFMHNVEPETGQ